MRKYYLIIAATVSLVFMSCEKLLIKPDKDATDPRKNFRFLWDYIHERYPYFEEKKERYGLDWNEVYNRYSARISDQMGEDKLFDELGSMMNELRDGHSNLISPFRVSFYDKSYLDTANFNWDIIVRNYLLKDTTQPTYNARSGTYWAVLKNNVGYVYYASFTNPITNLDRILKSFEARNVKGLVLDVRDNGGGYVNFAQEMAGRFITEKTYVGYSLIRTAPDQWSEPLKQYIEPAEYHWNKPVVLLTSKGTFSSGNLIASYLKPLDNVTLVGDSTGGGGALPLDYELPNGWHFRISEVPFFDAGGHSIEEGIAPELNVSQNPGSTSQGRDDILEKALDLLK